MTKLEIIDKVAIPILEEGFRCWFVGGCVRDELLEKEPHDYDVATDATPEDLHKIFKYFSCETGEKYGVTMPLITKEESIEIATLRKDLTPGRHPTITFTDCIQEDSSRRDFTINALYERPTDGMVFDPTGQGLPDLENKLIRFVGNPKDRCIEDPLRVIRFVRFMFSMNFAPADKEEVEATLQQLTADEHFFDDVSTERAIAELKKIFESPYFKGDNIDKFFDYVEKFNLEKVFKIEGLIDSLKSCPQDPKYHAEGSEVELLI